MSNATIAGTPRDLGRVLGLVQAHFPPGYGIASAAGQLPRRLSGMHFDTVLEIGTLRGQSAIVLAHFADTVITIDIVEQPEMREALELAGVADRVIPIVVASDAAKARVISRLAFDLAFLDGNHSRDCVEVDFTITRRCGSVLFHDYPHARWTGIREFVDTLPSDQTETDEVFAWWRAE